MCYNSCSTSKTEKLQVINTFLGHFIVHNHGSTFDGDASLSGNKNTAPPFKSLSLLTSTPKA